MACIHPTGTGNPIAMRQANGTIRKRRRSVNDPGHAHELTFSCYKGLPLLSRDRTREWFIEALDRARTRHEFELWAYVLMPEHVHVLLMPLRADYRMATILQAVKQPVASWAIDFLRGHDPTWLGNLRVPGQDGRARYRFWQAGGGYDRNITTPAVAWRIVEYIHSNPVRRGLVDDPTDWPWSSSRWYAGQDGVVLSMDATPPDP